MSIYATIEWIEGRRGNYGEPDGGFWSVGVATARHYGDGGIIRLDVVNQVNGSTQGSFDGSTQVSGDAFLSPAEARQIADALIRAAEECESAWR